MQRIETQEKRVNENMHATRPVQHASPSETSQDVFLHFSLADALPAGHVLVINRNLGVLSLIMAKDEHICMLDEQQFTSSEMNIVLPLLDAFPYYTPYEVLYAHFYSNAVTEHTVSVARTHLQEAQEEGTWELEMRALRTTLSRARLKLRMLGLNISSILETGYVLQVTSSAHVVANAKV